MREILGKLEDAAGLLVQAHPTDLPSLADLHKCFEELAALLGQHDHVGERVPDAAQASAVLLRQCIDGTAGEPAKVLDILSRGVTALQGVLRDGRKDEEVEFPDELLGAEPAEGGSATALDVSVDATTDERVAPDAMTAPQRETVQQGAALFSADPDLLAGFVTESREHLEAAEAHLLKLEAQSPSPESIATVSRALHSIEGIAEFLDLHDIASLSHEAENLLDLACRGELEVSDSLVDVWLRSVEVLKRQVERVETATKGDGFLPRDESLQEMLTDIRSVIGGTTSSEQLAGQRQEVGEPVAADEGLSSADSVGWQEDTAEEAASQIQRREQEVAAEPNVDAGEERPALEAEADGAGQNEPEIFVDFQREVADGQPERENEKEEANPAAAEEAGGTLVERIVAGPVKKAGRERAAAKPGSIAMGTIAVDRERLDKLVDTIGELVIAESMVHRDVEQVAHRLAHDSRNLTHLNKITRELQELSLSLRMVPIRNTFQKMARLVRDLSKRAGKKIDFRMEGEDTELDKTVVDQIGDPLVHMIRNAVDHGIENSSQERLAAGKAEHGRITLRAYHQGGNIYIELEDDGRGVDREKLLAKAIDRGVVREGDALSDRETLNLIFQAGVSTAKEVTDVSGRGVGMDVVRRNVESLRGSVEIDSEKGHGSTVSLRLPLTLAIIDGMVVRVGGNRYIIPTPTIVELLRPAPGDISTVAQRGEMLSVRGQLLPLFRVANAFRIAGGEREATQGIVVVVEDQGKLAGLLVDETVGQQQVVIKSLGKSLEGLGGLAGGAVMPDGRVGLILDIHGILSLAKEDRVDAA